MRGDATLAAVGLAVVAAFALQRARSPFLRIEAEADVAAEVATAAGMRVDDVMALRELIGVTLRGEELLARARDFAQDRERLGSEALAAVAAAGHRAVVERLWAEAAGETATAEALLRPLPEALAARRFDALRERFARRREH